MSEGCELLSRDALLLEQAGEPVRHGHDDEGRVRRALGREDAAVGDEEVRHLPRALARVDDGSYGMCGGCGEPIVPERLEILPAARYCLACQVRQAA